MKIPYSRHQGCSCSSLPQTLDNKEDGIFIAFPEGKNFLLKKMNSGHHFWRSPGSMVKFTLFILISDAFIFLIKFLYNIRVYTYTDIL